MASHELGLPEGIPITYRAGDQPNNALSLNVMEPGEIAATAGTSGVVYGVSGTLKYDPVSRVNSFAHVNHTSQSPHIGVLLCINGTGSANSWIRRITGQQNIEYARLNELASGIPPLGSNSLICLPFGNGAERMLKNLDIGAHFHNLQFNIHTQSHLVRAVQEGVAFAFNYGIEILHGMEIKPTVIRAGLANLFLSPIFCDTLANTAGITIELYNTDGAQGAARGAALGAKHFTNRTEMFKGLECVKVIEPQRNRANDYQEVYASWSSVLKRYL